MGGPSLNMQNVEGYAGLAGTEPDAWETGLMDTITYVGLDVHKATVSVALAEGGRGGEIRQVGVFENRPEVLMKLAARLSKGVVGCGSVADPDEGRRSGEDRSPRRGDAGQAAPRR